MNKILKIMLLICLLLGFHGAAQADLKSGLVAYYPFNGNSNDTSGNNHNLMEHGVTYVQGVNNQAVSFDGASNYLDVSNFPTNATLTVSYWANYTSLGEWTRIFGLSIN